MFPLLIVSSSDRRKQCQQFYPTHQLLKPFEFSCTVSPALISILCLSSILLPTSDRYICMYICGLRHLWYSLPHFEGRGDYRIVYSRIFQPTNNIRLYFLVAAIPWYLEECCYRRTLYFCICLPARFPIRNSFPCFLIYATTRDLWEFYLPRSEMRNIRYIHMYNIYICVWEKRGEFGAYVSSNLR